MAVQSALSKVVSAEKTYDAFGNVVSASGVWKSQFGYAGKFGYQSDPDTGLKLLGHRYYDSDTGRFLTRDPIKDGRNWYSYCENNPISFFDADGLAKVWVAWRKVPLTPYSHSLIIIKDEKTGKIYVIEGGPNWLTFPVQLQGGGRRIHNGDEYNSIMDFERKLLVDDDQTLDYWISRLTKNIPESVAYYPIGGLLPSANSNSFIREILERSGLDDKKPSTDLFFWEEDPWKWLGDQKTATIGGGSYDRLRTNE